MNNVDTKPEMTENGLASRARDGGPLDAEVLAREIENDPHLRKAVSLNAIFLSHPEIRALLVAEAVRGLGAMTQCWNATRKVYEPKVDYATRQKALAWIGSYSDGLPVQTNLNANLTPTRAPDADPVEMLARSPAAMEATERMLARAKKKRDHDSAIELARVSPST